MPILDLGEVRGPQGPQGPAGVSPTVQVDKTSSGTKVTITGAGGAQSFEITDGSAVSVGNGVNILDNWYFLDPINQRGISTEPKTAYSIDRWIVDGGDGLSVNDGHITVTGNLIQRASDEVTQYLLGKTLTLSCLLTDGSLMYGTLTAPNKLPSSTTVYRTSNSRLQIALYANGDIQIFRLSNCNNEKLIAVKAELGSVQTLAHKEGDEWVLNDPPPNKALELAKCQRYQIVFRPENYTSFLVVGTGIGIGTAYASCFVPLPVPLRGNYTISFSGDWVFDKGSTTSNTIAVTKMTSYNYRAKNGVSIIVSGESALEADKSYRLIGLNTPETNLLLDANL